MTRLTKRELVLVTPLPLIIAIIFGQLMAHLSERSFSRDSGKTGHAQSSMTNRPPSPRWMPNGRTSDYSIIGTRGLMDDGPARKQSVATPRPITAPADILQIGTTQAAATTAEGPAQEMVAVVGLVTLYGRKHAVIESVSLDETEFVPVGGQAFGYSVIDIGEDSVKLRKKSMEYTLSLGENKPDKVMRRPLRPEGGEKKRDIRETVSQMQTIIREQQFVEDHKRAHEERQRMEEIRVQREREAAELELQQRASNEVNSGDSD